MTIAEAIAIIDNLKPNGHSQDDKISWLSQLDGVIKTEIIDTHEGSEDVHFDKYTHNTSLNTELLVPAPYDDIYIKWMESKIDLSNGEYVKFNNSITLYNNLFSVYYNYYNRNHMPKGKKIEYF